MYHYLQFRPDKKESWHLIEDKKVANLDKDPAFISVLMVDREVGAIEEAGEDPLDHVKYRGPMYFDLDNEDDIEAVLESSRQLVGKIVKQFGVDPNYIQAWLSGGKGVHFTIPEQLFGVKRATKHLPVIYHELAKQVQVDNLDMSVYSAGKGRLWRCPNIARPGKGTFKVGVTLDELENMTAEDYQVLVASPRPELPVNLPPSNLSVPKAETAFKLAKRNADRRIRALKNAKTVPTEELRKLEETPGCVKKLITEGDCPESNWNQAAMQVAAWVAARYERDEEKQYLDEVVEPFLENVESSNRPSMSERRKHVRDQINRAFSGRTKFGVGPLIKTIGEPCNECPLCRGDIDFDAASEADSEEEPYDGLNRIKMSKAGYVMVSDNGSRNLASFTFWPHTEVRRLIETQEGAFQEGPREAYIGTIIDDIGTRFEDVTIPDEAWSSRSALAKEVGGHGSAMLFCTDVELQRIYRSTLRLTVEKSEQGAESMTETPICGIYLEHRGKVTLTHYIEHGASIMPTGSEKGSVQSRFRYNGSKNNSPRLIDEDFPYVDDQALENALKALCKVNDPENVAKVMGWFAACHLREHIHQVMPQFPLLNLWGNASAGKTMTALLFAHLNGMDYQDPAEPVNMETTRIYPLKKFVSSSTTVPRLVEEVNESGMKSRSSYMEVMGIFKAAWNRSTIQRGQPGKHGIRTEVDRVSSPIVYVSEQRTNRPAVRNRTIEVLLTAEGREVPGRGAAFDTAYENRQDLHRAAKAMLQYALTMSVGDVRELLNNQAHLVPKQLDERPQWSFKVAMAGIDFMATALERCGVDIREDLNEVKQALVDSLSANHRSIDRDKRTSEVDRVLMSLDEMAGEPDDRQCGIRRDEHYEKVGKWLKLDIRKMMTRYRRYCRSVSEVPVITDPTQLAELLAGETYFDRLQPRDDNPRVDLHVIDVEKLEEHKGMRLNNFQEDAETADAATA